jgi:hypothetical protein
MRNLKFSIYLLLTVLAAGCIPNKVVSMFPLYDEQTLTVEPNLVGSWAADQKSTWTFTKSESKAYRLVIAEVPDNPGEEKPDDEGMELEARLVQLSGRLFLDLYSEDAGPTGAPAHVFARVKIEKNALHIEWFDDDWLKDQLKQETYLSSINTPGGRIVLTAHTPELQYFYSRHAWDREADTREGEFHRIPDLPTHHFDH